MSAGVGVHGLGKSEGDKFMMDLFGGRRGVLSRRFLIKERERVI